MSDMPDLDGKTVSEFAASLRRYEDYDNCADDCHIAADVIEALKAENERLRDALREARPYVPEHHGPVMHKINAAITATDATTKTADNDPARTP